MKFDGVKMVKSEISYRKGFYGYVLNVKMFERWTSIHSFEDPYDEPLDYNRIQKILSNKSIAIIEEEPKYKKIAELKIKHLVDIVPKFYEVREVQTENA
jgi:hypothetical protein